MEGAARLIFAVVTGAAAMIAAAWADVAPLADVPCRTGADGHLYTDVFVNDAGPFSFLIDTAATVSTVSPEVAGLLSLEPMTPEERKASGEGDRVVYTLLGQDVFPPRRLNAMRVGGIVRESFVVVVVPNKAGGPKQPDGVLGLDFLDAYLLEFDLAANGRLRVYPAGAEPAFADGWTAVPLRPRRIRRVDTQLWFVTARVGYRAKVYPTPALFDLGAGFSVINKPTMRAIGLRAAMERTEGSIADPRGREMRTYLIRALPFRIGAETWKRDIIGGNLPVFALFGLERRPAAIAGADLFAGRSFAIDFAGQRLLIAPSDNDRG